MTMFPKPGIVRLKGKDLAALRIAVFLRDRGRCFKCGRLVALNDENTAWNMPPMHLVHLRNKRNHGDTLENTACGCPQCHLVEMHNPKSVPPKERTA